LAYDFKPAEAAGLARAESFVRKSDARLRPSILPGLLEAVRRNEANGVAGARLFEMGSTFWHLANGGIEEHRRLSLVGSSDLREVRGVVETILTELDGQRPMKVVPDSRAGFARAACGKVQWGERTIGFIGKIDRAVTDQLGLREQPAAAELFLPDLILGAQHVPQLKPLPKYPSVRRDLSLDVSESTKYESIEQLVRSLKRQWLDDIEFVTTYRGKPLEKGQKSVTITLVFRSDQSTLTSEEVEQSVQRVMEAARTQLGAKFRS
jgi:phenylalanyl-tRNA synthetase beta chain